MDSQKKHRYVVVLVCGILLLLGVGAAGLVKAIISSKPPTPKKIVQEVQLIRPPPPPPDVPPPPPPPPEENVVPDPQQPPDPTPSNDPPPSEHLGLDAEGTAGGDAFGLVGNKGGREITGVGGSVFTWYEGLVKGEILEQLNEDEKLRKGSYKAGIQIWIRADGSVDHVRILRSSGDPARDRAIETRVESHRFSRAPPSEIPQPVTVGMSRHN